MSSSAAASSASGSTRTSTAGSGSDRAGFSRNDLEDRAGGDRGRSARGPAKGSCRSLGASLELKLRWHGEGLDRLLDEAHARVVDATVVLLRDAGWDVAVEASFSIW